GEPQGEQPPRVRHRAGPAALEPATRTCQPGREICDPAARKLGDEVAVRLRSGLYHYQRDRRPPRPPRSPRSLDWAMLTLIRRPSSSVPSMALIASSAEAGESMVTKPKPRERPV